MLKLLLKFGADPGIRSEENNTPLEMAEEAGKDQVIKVLKGWK
jgi:ankyrin repeat protein